MATNRKHWVLLAAGSKGWSNYRHQADVCNAYQLFRRKGIPNEQIVVMMYDDIAYHPENPEPGVIIHEPNGDNVYRGVPLDYTQDEVTDKNFLAALRGDKGAVGGKMVIESNRQDTIFVYISGHGSPGMFCFPNTRLHADDLVSTVKEMAENHQFSQMVIYVESCFSGSMLEDLPENIKVYGTTASSPKQYSYACIYDETRETFLADAYSTIWMDHMHKYPLRETTFQQQLQHLQSTVRQSTPQPYGNMALKKRLLSSVFGTTALLDLHISNAKSARNLTDMTCNQDVPLKILEAKFQKEKDPAKKDDLQKKIDTHKATKTCFAKGLEECKKHLSLGTGVAKDRSARQRDFRDVADHFGDVFRDLHETELEIALSATHVFLEFIDIVDVDHLKAGIGVMKTAMGQ